MTAAALAAALLLLAATLLPEIPTDGWWIRALDFVWAGGCAAARPGELRARPRTMARHGGRPTLLRDEVGRAAIHAAGRHARRRMQPRA
ncbi:hypothetical protein [Falsiroseomonas sp. CW058]|uniref:hypothetical protein n=1 Tax=Falsiroseomonas sp. CW058 TaxID=3388664 RepID=UPI003D30FF51